MAVNLPRVRRFLRRLARGRALSLEDLSVREDVLLPRHSRRVAPALHLPGQMERVVEFSPWRIPEADLASVRGEEMEFDATRRHLLEGVEIFDPYLYAGPSKLDGGFGAERTWLPGPFQKLSGQYALATTYNGARWFGCLLLDDLTLEVVPQVSEPKIIMPTGPFSHEEGYREALSLPRPTTVTAGRVEGLWVFSEPAISSSRGERYDILRRRLRETWSTRSAERPEIVYVRRGRTGELRVLENEPEVEAALREMGATVVDPATDSVESIITRSLDAEIVVGVEGSQLSHAIFTIADAGRFLVLQPPQRFAMAYKDFTDSVGMRFGFLVGSLAPGGFRVDIDELRRSMEMMAAAG